MLNRPTIPDILSLAEWYLNATNGVGGNLHIALADNNLHDGHIWSCLERAIQDGDTPGTLLAAAMYQMTRTQRGKLTNRVWELYQP